MATFLTLQQEVADRLNLDQTVTANATKLKRWINLTQQDILGRWQFPFLYERMIVQTQPDKTAGTVSVANGATSVAGVSTAFAAGDKRSFIQFSGSINWYEVTAVGGTTSLTISPTYNETAVSGGTYVLRKRYYDLAAAVERVYDVCQTDTPAKLSCMGIFALDQYSPDISINQTSVPIAYYLFRQDPDVAVSASPIRQIAFYPAPDSYYNLEVRYLKYLSDLSGDTDVPLIPQQYMNILLDGAEAMGRVYLNDENPRAKQAYEYGIAKMIEQESSLDDQFPILASSDQGQQIRFLPFPPLYPAA